MVASNPDEDWRSADARAAVVRDILTRLVMEETRVRITALLDERGEAHDWHSDLEVSMNFAQALPFGRP